MEIGKFIDSLMYIVMAFVTPYLFYAYFKPIAPPFYKKKWTLIIAPFPALAAVLSIYDSYWGL